MNIQKRRSFRPRQQKNGYRRNNGISSHKNSHFQKNGGNQNFSSNGSMTNPFNVEKTMQKYQQLAKDAQMLGDPVLVENYLQHADHYLRRLTELNSKSPVATPKNEDIKQSLTSNSPGQIEEKSSEKKEELKNTNI